MEKAKVVISYQLSVIRKWIQNNKKEFWILLAILLIGAFFRLYKIGGYMTFLGDEGRDVIIVRRLLVDFDLILIGPRTSIGDMYLGPIYYYMMAPALLLANFSPVGPAIMIALLGVATIFLVWFVAREWFPPTPSKFTLSSSKGSGQVNIAAIVAAGLYAISPVVITYSHSSWNPNIMPFFALLSIYGIWKVWMKGKYKWLIIVGISMAFVLQSHYLGLLLIPTVGVFWLLALLKTKKVTRYKIQGTKRFISYTLYAAILLIVLMSPLVIFDARHGWRNFASMKVFFTQRQTTVSARPWTAIPKMWPIFQENVVTRIISGGDLITGEVASWIILVGTLLLSLYYLPKIRRVFAKNNVKDKQLISASGFFLIFVWIFVGLTGAALYKQHIYDHYFGFMYPALFLLVGVIVEKVHSNFGDDGKIFATAGVVLLTVVNLNNNPLRYEPNYQMNRAFEVAKLIQKEAGGNEFNLAVIAERNYEDGYQYFLEKDGSQVIDIDAQIPETLTDQLFVVCELPKQKCDPTHSSKAEVANFGWSRVEEKWEDFFGITLYKLVHTE